VVTDPHEQWVNERPWLVCIIVIRFGATAVRMWHPRHMWIYGYARFLLVPSRRFRVKTVRVAELDKKKTSWAPITKYEKIIGQNKYVFKSFPKIKFIKHWPKVAPHPRYSRNNFVASF
jgi:hypothetical protein